jgi:hypothetical protein
VRAAESSVLRAAAELSHPSQHSLSGQAHAALQEGVRCWQRMHRAHAHSSRTLACSEYTESSGYTSVATRASPTGAWLSADSCAAVRSTFNASDSCQWSATADGAVHTADLLELFAGAQSDRVIVNFGEDDIIARQVDQQLLRDATWSGLSLLSAAVMLRVGAGSTFLTIVGIFQLLVRTPASTSAARLPSGGPLPRALSPLPLPIHAPLPTPAASAAAVSCAASSTWPRWMHSHQPCCLEVPQENAPDDDEC